LGSVEVFPRKRGVATLADVWRVAPVRGGGVVKVRAARLEDYAGVRALQRAAQPDVPAWSLKQFESQRHAFPEGQLVAESDGEVVGAASSFVVQWDDYAVDHTWKGVSGDGFFTTHDSQGRTLYGAEVLLDVSRRGFGVGRALHQAQRRLCRKLNLRRIIGAARLPGYRAVHAEMSPELYAMRVIWGDIDDPMLRFPMSQGFHYCGIIHNYLPEDAASCGHAALMVWLNPLFSPPGPPAFANSQRTRKVA
jgi:GNAT superfamily N-acetyltransferase